MTAEQRACGEKKAAALLAYAGIDCLEAASVLDVGCGFGDLTYGLGSIGRLRNCQFYAIDHSLESLRILAEFSPAPHGNRLYLSTQDASALCFPDETFELVVGSAVLHHILDYRSFLRTAFRILKPGGRAIFSEPFLPGYLLPSLMLAIAVDQLKLTAADLRRPEFGMCRFIIDDTANRVQHEDDLAVLDSLADKHYFRSERISETAYSLGFRSVTLTNYEPPEFYTDFMRHFLWVYGITESRLTILASRYYEVFRGITGSKLPDLVSHFKYIVLSK